MIDVNEILAIIKATRKEMKISQEDMGKKIGVAKETYRDIENGKISLKIEEYIRICKCLNISASQLLCLFDEKKYLHIPISDDEIQTFKKILNRISDDLELLQKSQKTDFFINSGYIENSNIVIKSKIEKNQRDD